MNEFEFIYSDSVDLGRGRHRQEIMYKGKAVGYLLSIEKNWFAPIEELYILPDIDYGLQEGENLLEGKKGWIDFVRFDNYDEAFKYVTENFEKLAYLYEFGDYD